MLRDIPAIPGWPIVGNAIETRFARLSMLDRVWDQCGPVARLRLGRSDIVVVTDGALAHDVLVTNADAYVKRRTLGEFARPLLGSGLLTSEHELHARQRRRMAGAFPHAKVIDWVAGMAALAEAAQASWTEGEAIDASRAMMKLTLEIVTSTLFGSDVSREAEVIRHSVTEANRHISDQATHVVRAPGWFPTPSVVRNRAALRRLDTIVYQMIEARRQAGPRSDLLSSLLDAEDAADGRMTDQEIRDEVMTLMFAGHETTANALGWVWLLLSGHPTIAAALRAELDCVLGGRTPTIVDLPALPLALQIFKEALRLYPPVYFVGRIASRPVSLAGFRLLPGTTVGVNIWGMHHRPDVFADPARFDPARFDQDRERDIPRSFYLPFGAGPRVCIGNQFALVEGQVLIATLAQRVEIDATRSRSVQPEPLVTLRQRGGIAAEIHRRSLP